MRRQQGAGAKRLRKGDVPPNQMSFPLFDHGLQAIHDRPLVADETKYIRGRRPAMEAWDDWPYVESNPPHVYAGLFFDIDDPDRWEHEVDGPLPNWQIRKDSVRVTYHVAYTLEIPVARHDAALLRPLRFYRDIYDGLALKISADLRYSGLMTKNPINPPPGCSAQWFRRQPYTLSELREWLPDEIPRPIHSTGVGRNEDLFRHCVRLAHQPRWARIIQAEGHAGQWLDHVRLSNVSEYGEDALPDVECRSIAKSCAKYSLRQYSEATFSEIQTARNSKRWHDDSTYDYVSRSETVGMMVSLGYRHREIAAIFGVTEGTIRRDLAKFRRRHLESDRVTPGIP